MRFYVLGMFIYKEKGGKHSYELDGASMTGVTTVLGEIGSKDNLMTWYSNMSTNRAFRLVVPVDYVEIADKLISEDRDKKLSTTVALKLDKMFPEFKEARTEPNRISKQAAKVGTQAHLLCELFERGTIDSQPGFEEQAITRAQAYVKWYGENIQSTLFVEKPLFSRSMFLGGTPDGGFLDNSGKFLINDKKFKGSIFSFHPFLQMAAYRLMLEEMSKDDTTPMRLEYEDGSVEEFKSPQEYLASLGTVRWDGSVVILVNEKAEVKPVYRYAFDEDAETFRAALRCYRKGNEFIPVY